MHSTVYLADADASFREQLAHRLKSYDFSIIGEGGNGVSALRDILYAVPDLIILDAELFENEVADVIRIIRHCLPSTVKIIIVSVPKNAPVITAALGAGADNCILKPCTPDDAASLIFGLSEKNSADPREEISQSPVLRNRSSEHFTDIRISHLLHMVGISANVSGYFYLRTAIRMTLDSPEVLLSVTKTLYPAIAKAHGTKSTCVERSIRHAIEKLWYDRQLSQDGYDRLEYVSSGMTEKPTNSEFIALAADRIRLTES